MSEIPKCPSWLGHKFIARYSTGKPTLEESRLIWIYGSDRRLQALRDSRPQTYEGDVCVRCGCVVNQAAAA